MWLIYGENMAVTGRTAAERDRRGHLPERVETLRPSFSRPNMTLILMRRFSRRLWHLTGLPRDVPHGKQGIIPLFLNASLHRFASWRRSSRRHSARDGLPGRAAAPRQPPTWPAVTTKRFGRLSASMSACAAPLNAVSGHIAPHRLSRCCAPSACPHREEHMGLRKTGGSETLLHADAETPEMRSTHLARFCPVTTRGPRLAPRGHRSSNRNRLSVR